MPSFVFVCNIRNQSYYFVQVHYEDINMDGFKKLEDGEKVHSSNIHPYHQHIIIIIYAYNMKGNL